MPSPLKSFSLCPRGCSSPRIAERWQTSSFEACCLAIGIADAGLNPRGKSETEKYENEKLPNSKTEKPTE